MVFSEQNSLPVSVYDATAILVHGQHSLGVRNEERKERKKRILSETIIQP